MWKRFMEWTARRSQTDLWRAGIGIVLAFTLLLFLTACASGPRMTLGASYEGDGFIRLTQPVYQKNSIECFVEYEHHSEIFTEYNERVGDFGIAACTKQFGRWVWLD